MALIKHLNERYTNRFFLFNLEEGTLYRKIHINTMENQIFCTIMVFGFSLGPLHDTLSKVN